ncbi:hypothetical protein HY477_03245 [Candidatus Uhrbacteria bacterium]|nr:hypothetical protein [Candidatus Uhrbacteria bacterium]
MSKWRRIRLCSLVFVFLFVGIRGVSATEITSDSFKILDPVIEEGGRISTSNSYRLIGSFSENALGRSTSTSFTVNSGSLAYAEATVPVLTASDGVGEVSLSWTASQGALGWTISGYDVCQGTATNTYTSCTDVGNVLTSSRTGLTVGTLYFFRIRAKDAFGNVVVRSGEDTASPVATGGGGGGGGGSGAATVADVTLSGRAYPSAVVSLFQNGAVVRAITAAPDGRFSSVLTGVANDRTYTFGAQARDGSGRTSILLTYTVNVPANVAGVSLEFFLTPTIELTPTAVTQGGNVTVRGSAFPGSTVRVEIPSVVSQTTTTQSNGTWSTAINTENITPGSYTVRATAQANGDTTEVTAPQTLTIASTEPSPPPPPACPSGSDLNLDGRINLADVSTLLTFWNSTAFTNACADINTDGRVDLVDFSILLFNWNG